MQNKAKCIKSYGFKKVFFGTLFCSLLISSLCFLNSDVSAASTITVSITDNVSLDIYTTSEGQFATSDTSANNVTVRTNNGTGYTLSIKAKTEGSNALINTNDPSITIPSITSAVSESDYSSSSTYNNTWGYRPSKYNSQANTNYLPLPTSASSETVLDKTTVSNPSTDNNYNIAIGTRLNNTIRAGSYANTFVISVVANPAIYSITYNQNTSDTVTNMPTNVVNQPTFNSSVNIDSTVPARSGYNFKGWCTAQLPDGSDATVCTNAGGTTYNPDGGGTSLAWPIDSTIASNSLSLYAMWEIAGINLYNSVASMSKGTQTLAELRAAITASNSGVYEYNSSVFGTSSDASNDNKIYYYRGILDNTTGSYGSDGDNAAWPNTVVLSSASSKSGLTTNDTCWRIIRTTGSGGVKMIYQGKWTGSTCANAQTSTQVTTSAFNGTSSTKQQIVRVGYTHNSTYAVNTSKSGTIAQVFGSNSNPGANNTRSTIKEYIEDTWYANNMTSYTSKLEASAGYCNDRTMNTTESWTTPLAESSTIASTYGTSVQVYYFGAYPRNLKTAQAPSLACGNKYSQIDRGIVDLYRYVAGSTGVSNELKYPTALITTDEATFAGSGYSSSTTPYNTKSFLRSGSDFWLLSPYYRSSGGYVDGFCLALNGRLDIDNVNNANGVRPAISLISGTTAVSGTGTAADPWIVNPSPPTSCTTPVPNLTYMQDLNSSNKASILASMTEDSQYYLTDRRDNKAYCVAKLKDGNIWMTQNLDHDIKADGSVTYDSTTTDITTAWTPSTATYPTSTTTWNGSATAPESYDPGELYWSGAPNDTTPVSTGNSHYYLGNYYNWTAAVAMNDSSSYVDDEQDVNQSICPANWTLPKGGIITSSGSFQYLATQYGWVPFQMTNPYIWDSPIKDSLGGRWAGSLGNIGKNFYFWSPIVYDDSASYVLYGTSNGGVKSDLYFGRSLGSSVRCMAR